MLKRNIDFDQFEPTLDEKIFRAAKRVCVVFAVSAVTLSALDLANIRTVENAAAFIHENRSRVSELPEQIRSAIDSLSFAAVVESATVAIPRGDIAAAQRPSIAAARTDGSPVAQLASVRHMDAIEFAMESPVASSKSQQRVTAEPAPRGAPMRLASVDPSSMPSASNAPEPVIGAPTLSLSMSAAIPLNLVPIPRAAPGLPPPSPAERLNLTDPKERAKAERCLANAIYFEARSEPVRGQMAVAQVVINRAFSGFYPNDICGVVYQNAHRRLACQFTFACDGKSKVINERGHWARANRIAKQTLDGQLYVPEVAKSTHYHAVYVHPNWVREMKKMVRYGLHNFYRPYAWGNGDDNPAWGNGPGAMAEKKK